MPATAGIVDYHLLRYKESQAKLGPRVLLPVLPLSTIPSNYCRQNVMESKLLRN